MLGLDEDTHFTNPSNNGNVSDDNTTLDSQPSVYEGETAANGDGSVLVDKVRTGEGGLERTLERTLERSDSSTEKRNNNTNNKPLRLFSRNSE